MPALGGPRPSVCLGCSRWERGLSLPLSSLSALSRLWLGEGQGWVDSPPNPFGLAADLVWKVGAALLPHLGTGEYPL